MPMLATPSSDVVGLTPYQSSPVPSTPVAMANSNAFRLLISPRTRGLFFVRLILASCCGSNSMFNVLADAICKNVPLVRKRSVRVLREGASVTAVLSSAGTGYIEYDAVLVRTTRKASRGFESERYVENARRKDLAGAAAASLDSCEDASSGSGASDEASFSFAAAAAAFNRFRRRCGGSSMEDGAVG